MKTSSFAMVLGLIFLALGMLGLAPAMLTPPPVETPPTSFTFLYGYLLGLFPTNILLTLLRIATGVWALLAAASAGNAAVFARGAALLYGLLAVMGMVPILNTVFGLMPVHGNDIWLHAVTAAVAAYFGWREEPEAAERRSKRLDRRHRVQAVALERRHGLADRRFAHARMMAGI